MPLVPILGKIFEVCIKEQIYSFFVCKCNEQFGFLSCGKAVEKVVKQVLENYETKVLSATTQIDFIKTS